MVGIVDVICVGDCAVGLPAAYLYLYALCFFLCFSFNSFYVAFNFFCFKSLCYFDLLHIFSLFALLHIFNMFLFPARLLFTFVCHVLKPVYSMFNMCFYMLIVFIYLLQDSY